jgi:uncharacterized membrane protein
MPQHSDPIFPAPIQGAIAPVQPVVKTISVESHERLWETKFDIYLRVCKAAGILAVSRSDSDAFVLSSFTL